MEPCDNFPLEQGATVMVVNDTLSLFRNGMCSTYTNLTSQKVKKEGA